jgi:hypothetical protein
VPAPKPQSFANHSRLVPGFHYYTFSAIVVVTLWAAWSLLRTPSIDSVVGLLQAGALIGLFWYCRIFPLTAQDRVIRLEERLRLHRLLPPEQAATAVERLTARQLIALRFASDEELPDLVRRVLAGELTGGKEIKQAVRQWRADHLRV